MLQSSVLFPSILLSICPSILPSVLLSILPSIRPSISYLLKRKVSFARMYDRLMISLKILKTKIKRGRNAKTEGDNGRQIRLYPTREVGYWFTRLDHRIPGMRWFRPPPEPALQNPFPQDSGWDELGWNLAGNFFF